MKKFILFVMLIGAFIVSNVAAQVVVKDSTTVSAISGDAAATVQVSVPALPGVGEGILTWLVWVLGLAIGIDVLGRFIPTSGKWSWITKVVGLLHDFLLYLDNTKKEPAKKTTNSEAIVQPDKPVKP